MDPKELTSLVAAKLKRCDFRRSGTTWRRQTPDLVTVVNLQRSAWSPLYYVNLAVAIRALLRTETPKEHHCHLRVRPGEIGVDSALLKDALDLEKLVPDDVRAAGIESILDSGTSWLGGFQTLDDLRRAVATNPRLASSTTHAAQRHLGLG